MVIGLCVVHFRDNQTSNYKSASRVEVYSPHFSLNCTPLEDEVNYEYEIWLKVFRVFSKYKLPWWLHCTIFTRKVTTITCSEGGYTLSQSQNDKTTNILVTCFCHFDILAKTRSRVTTPTTFSRQNDTGLRARTT